MVQEVSKLSSNTDLLNVNDEETIVKKIAFVLCENQWTGDMINNGKEFNKSTFDALLDVGQIPKNNPTVRYVWKVIHYSQQKTVDETFNEEQLHIKWFWFDCRQLNNNWIWKKYNVVICQWISKCYELFLIEYKNVVKDGLLEFDFLLCEQELQKRKQNEKRNKNIVHDEKDGEFDDEKVEEFDEKVEEFDEKVEEFEDEYKDDEKSDVVEEMPVKPITIDHQLNESMNNGVHHSLVIEWNFDEKKIELWHKKYAPKSEVNKFNEYHEIRNELQVVYVDDNSIDRKVIHTPFEGFSK